MRMSGRVSVALVAILSVSNFAFGQISNSGKEVKHARVNFRELAAYYQAHPQPIVRQMPIDEDEDEDHRIPHAGPSSQVHMYHPAVLRQAMGPSYVPMLPASAAPNDTFLSTASPGSSIPPDTHGAVDSQYCFTAINTDIHIQDRVGGNVYDLGLGGFWGSVLPASTGTFDPRVIYDPYKRRWILVTDAVASPSMTVSTILIAVSETNDPTGTWNMYAIAVDPTGAAWMDFPNVGFNSKWIVVTGNMFPNSTGGASGGIVYVFDYASIMAGTGAPFVKYNEPASFSICPALTYDATDPNIYAVESWNGNAGQLRLWEITGPVGSPTFNSVGYPATTQHWHGSGTGSNFATQSGTANKVDAGDDRFTSLVFKNKKLWCSHTVFLPSPGTASRSSIMWWQMDTLGNPLQIGMIDDPATPTFFDFSSIAVNDSDDALIGFGYLNATIHPSAGYALHLHTDPADSTRPPHIFRHGQSTYFTTFGGARNRWGDYSGACIDPRNNMDFWTIQEVSNTAGTTANWECWWANVQICPKPPQPTMLYTSTPCLSDTGTFIINPIPGATSYIWYVSGPGWSGASTTPTLNAMAGTGVGTIVVLAYNSCGEGESHTFNITPATVPPAPSIGVYTPPCSGIPTAVFTASGVANFNWMVTGTGWSGSSTSSTLNATVGTGTADIICYATNACGVGLPDTLVITPGTPVAMFTEDLHTTVVNGNVVATFTGTAPAGSAYTWNFSGGVATPGFGPGPQTVHWTSGGTKTVSLTVDNFGCSASYADTVQVRDVTGVGNLSGGAGAVSIVPNPSDGLFDILFANAVSGLVDVQIADMEGKIIFRDALQPSGSNRVSVNAVRLVPGTYIATITVQGLAQSQKITITK